MHEQIAASMCYRYALLHRAFRMGLVLCLFVDETYPLHFLRVCLCLDCLESDGLVLFVMPFVLNGGAAVLGSVCDVFHIVTQKFKIMII